MITARAPRRQAGRLLRAVTSLAVAGSMVLSMGITSAAPVAADDPGYPANCLPGSGAIWGCGTLTDAQIHDLISMMTVAEEDGFIHGGGSGTGAGEAGSTRGVVRLGIPAVHLTDGPAGVRLSTRDGDARPGGPDRDLGSRRPPSLRREVGRPPRQRLQDPPGYGDNARQGENVWLAPMINMVKYVTGGRNFETLGEDPYLAASWSPTRSGGCRARA